MNLPACRKATIDQVAAGEPPRAGNQGAHRWPWQKSRMNGIPGIGIHIGAHKPIFGAQDASIPRGATAECYHITRPPRSTVVERRRVFV
jgi:hypothetical protein